MPDPPTTVPALPCRLLAEALRTGLPRSNPVVRDDIQGRVTTLLGSILD